MSELEGKAEDREFRAIPGVLRLLGAVFIVFLTLKLLGRFDHSWWIVTAPLWAPFALVFAGFFLAVQMLGVAAAGEHLGRRKKRP